MDNDKSYKSSGYWLLRNFMLSVKGVGSVDLSKHLHW